MTDFRIHSASLDGTLLPGCVGYAAEAGRQVQKYGMSGSANRRLVAAGRYSQAVSLRTSGLKVLLSKLLSAANAPVPCASLASGTGLLMAASATDSILPKDTAAAAERLTITKGLIALRSIGFGEVGSEIVCDVGVWPVSADGDTSGWAIAQGAIPSLPSAEEIYSLHSMTWKGTSLDGMTGGSLTMSTAPTPMHNPGKIYPTYIRQAPTTGPIEIDAECTMPDRSFLRTYGEHFHGGAAGDLVIVFRPFLHAAARDTDGSEDVTFTLTGVAEVTGAEDGRPGSVKLAFHGVKTDGTSPLAWA